MSDDDQVNTDKGADSKHNTPVMDELSFVYDVPVTLQVMLGEATMTIGDVLKCGKGAVIPLKQKLGDPFLVMIQRRPIAEGEVVEAGDQIGIKITRVINDENGKGAEVAKSGEGGK